MEKLTHASRAKPILEALIRARLRIQIAAIRGHAVYNNRFAFAKCELAFELQHVDFPLLTSAPRKTESAQLNSPSTARLRRS
jgi:hypothetical protein